MRTLIAIIALASLSGCATYDPHWLAKNPVMGNSNNYHSSVISTPSGTYTVRSTTTGSNSNIQVYRTHR